MGIDNITASSSETGLGKNEILSLIEKAISVEDYIELVKSGKAQFFKK